MKLSSNLEKKTLKHSFKYIFKGSGNMYENSGSQFFRTTTGLQSRPVAWKNQGQL